MIKPPSPVDVAWWSKNYLVKIFMPLTHIMVSTDKIKYATTIDSGANCSCQGIEYRECSARAWKIFCNKFFGTVHREIHSGKEEFEQVLVYIKRKELIKNGVLIVNKLI